MIYCLLFLYFLYRFCTCFTIINVLVKKNIEKMLTFFSPVDLKRGVLEVYKKSAVKIIEFILVFFLLGDL